MKSILEELWYGNISPHEEKMWDTPRTRELICESKNAEKELTDRMDETTRRLYERCAEYRSELTATCLADAFTRGFSLGIKFLLASLG